MKKFQKILVLAFVCSYTFLGSQVNLTNGLTACYNLNGQANDAINSLNGTLSSVTVVADRLGNPGSALDFAGNSSSMVRLPNSPLIKPSPAISVSGWYKVSAYTHYAILLFAKNSFPSYHTAYDLAIQNSSSGYKFAAWRQDGSGSDFVEGTTTIALNTWYHVVFTIDNSSMRIYVNGQLEKTISTAISSFNYDMSSNVILGGTDESYNVPYTGSIDNLRFYSRILTNAEVTALYNQDPACQASALSTASFSVFPAFYFPNPVTDKFTISTDLSGELAVDIYNLEGKHLLSDKCVNGTSFDLGSFAPGMYLLTVKAGGESKTLKLIKQ